VMRRYSEALTMVKLAGGLYLLWLAWQAARKAWRARTAMPVPGAEADGHMPSLARTAGRGLALHLTNPKAIFVWLSFVSLALPPGARQADALAVVGHCGLISASVFGAYALVFSTSVARRGYQAAERPINALLAGVFGFAGVRMLLSSQGR
jgi:threonine efflux protein